MRIGEKMSERKITVALKRIFHVLKNIDGESSITELASKLNLRVSTVSDYIRDLEALGLIRIEIKEGFPRKIVPKLTEKGKCIVRCLAE